MEGNDRCRFYCSGDRVVYVTIHYVDLSIAAAGAGSGTELDPYSDFTAFASSISAGDRIRVKRGTSKVLTAATRLNVTITGSGGLTTLIDTYGTGAPPVLSGGSTNYNPIYVKRHEGGGKLIVRDLDVTLSAASGCRVESQSGVTISNVTLQRIRAYATNAQSIAGSDGISVGCALDGGLITNVSIEDCLAYSNNGHGIKVRDNTHAIRVRRCRVWANGLTTAAHGMGTSHSRVQVTSAVAWSATSGGAYQASVTPSFKTTVTEWFAVWCSNQNGYFWLTPDASSPPALGKFYTGGSNTLEINVGAAPTASIVRAAYLPCWAEFENCEASLTNDVDGFEGFGIGIDDLTEYAGIIGCTSFNNEGAGMSGNTSQRILLSGSVFHNNTRQGIYIPGAKNTDIYNSTFVENGLQGFRTNSGSTSTFIRNSIFAENTGYGMSSSSTIYPIDEDYNCVYGNTGGSKENISTSGSNGITTDPTLDANYRITDSSPCYQAGVFASRARDWSRRKLRGDPDIVAHQYYAARSAVADVAKSTATARKWL